ncbi:MAG TPA: NUDIX domain-containing protein [Aggregatilineales bacterium]|nr:NUDIX domain-containing protein [Aggregatilineales bacterium]
MTALNQHLSDTASLDRALADLTRADDYTHGVLDLLYLLGLVEPGEGGFQPGGEVSAMVIASLQAHLADGVRVGLHWDDLDADGLRGVDILRAIEAARSRAVEQATPGRTVRVVQAVIKGRRGGEDVYLMQFDRHAGRYQPIGGKQDPEDASPEAALRREIMEELCLPAVPGPDVLALTPLEPPWQTREISATYGILTAYEMRFFAASEVGFPLALDDDTRWLTLAELERGMADDGRAISPVYQQGLDGGLARLDALPGVVEVR